ncbi:hypothetical protein [Morganella morganii]|uniref:hypothetical protein n=1 Tax=Morganella morganii TaxID=582 RepID=UPI002367D668|nr:hypothetical protein [Morganella morganii]
MINKKEKMKLKKQKNTPLYGNIKLSVETNIQTTLIAIVFSIFFIFSETINLTKMDRISLVLPLVIFVFLFGSWYSFRDIRLATKLTIIYIKIKIKKLIIRFFRK